jgi:hypothetical protein
MIFAGKNTEVPPLKQIKLLRDIMQTYLSNKLALDQDDELNQWQDTVLSQLSDRRWRLDGADGYDLVVNITLYPALLNR